MELQVRNDFLATTNLRLQVSRQTAELTDHRRRTNTHAATAEEKARVELLESLLNAAPVEEEGAEEGVEEEKGA